MTGITKIQEVFNRKNRAALMPYYTIGYPNYDVSIDAIEACCNAGADLMELGMSFSDPLADGPTIQRATQIALEQGINIAGCIEAVRTLRSRNVTTPFLLMGYTNPILSYGLSNFITDAARAGADGFIIPDLPPEEAEDFERHCAENGLAVIHLLAPNSTPERMKLVLDKTSAFVYLVSVTGITGARKNVSRALEDYVLRVRSAASKPVNLAVGFGIANDTQAGEVATFADGVIVGSALINSAAKAQADGRSVPEAAAEFISLLAKAVK